MKNLGSQSVKKMPSNIYFKLVAYDWGESLNDRPVKLISEKLFLQIHNEP